MSRPPRIARWLLARLLHPRDRRFALADLDEEFQRRRDEDGPRRARRWYRRQVLSSALPALRHRWRSRTGTLLEQTTADVRFAVRTLLKTPLITLVVVLSLAVGIAASTTVFAAVESFLFRAPSDAVHAPDELVSVFTSDNRGEPWANSSYPDFRDIAEQVDGFTGVAAHRLAILRVGRDDATRQVVGEVVTGNYFDVLGVRMTMGRSFTPDETVVGAAESVAVISHRLWQEELGGDPDPVGRSIHVDGRDFTVVGVAPADLVSRVLALKIDVWVPVGLPGGVFLATDEELRSRGDRVYGIVGRLREGSSVEAVQAQLEVVADRLVEQHEQVWTDLNGRSRRLTARQESASYVPPNAFGALAAVSGVVLAATVLLLLVACSNVAGVMLARAQQRRAEIAVRQALGASRRRLVRMLLVESLLLATLAAALGLLLSHWALGAFDSVALPVADVAMHFDLRVSPRTLLFVLGLGTLTALLFGMAPAIQATRPELVPSLKGDGARRPRQGGRLRRGLVLVQVAVALAFVIGAGVALRSFDELSALDWGIDPADMAVMSLQLEESLDADELVAHYRQLHRRLASRPEIDAVTVANTVEAASFAFSSSIDLRPVGAAAEAPGATVFPVNAVAPGYLEMMGIELRRGRGIEERDGPDAARVAVITASLGRRFWPGEDPVGRQLQAVNRPTEMAPDGRTYTVVGIAADAPYEGLGSGDEYVWTSLYQEPRDQVLLVARGRGGPAGVLRLMRSEILPEQQGFTLVTPRRLRDLIHFQFGFIRFMGRLLAGAGAFGLALAMIGLYGIVSYAVSARRREIAVRQAVGALPRQVLRRVFQDGMRLAAWGLAVGLALAVPASLFVRSLIHQVSPLEPLSLAVGAAVVLAATALASWIPARRAIGVDPATVLRDE